VQAGVRGFARRLVFEHSVLLLAIVLAASFGAGLWYSYHLQRELVATLAEQGTRLQATILQELRTLYTSAVVERVRAAGIEVTHDYQAKHAAIPLPATLTIELGERIAESGSGLGVRLYSDYPFPWRKHGGPRDAFERDALTALRRDPSRPFVRYEEVRGEQVLRYAVADSMRPACALIEIARNNSERLVRLINDILDLEKIEAGQMRLELAPHELGPLVEQAVAANRAYAEQFGVSYALSVHCPGCCARVDADRLMQVMTNLMGNAAKFSPRGAEVELRLMRDSGRVRFLVSDRGPGIPAAFRDKLFAKFSQADSSDTRRKGGTGLGLSISKAIIEAMGGRIGFESREGAGSTFFFDLPEWSPLPALLEPDRGEGEREPSATQRPRVLVCEDDRDVATLLCLLLERAGYQAVAAHDAASARRLLAEGGFAAMTLDLQLPDLDGRAFLRELREDPATRELAVIVVSGHVRQRARADEGDGLGVVDWLDKPIDEARLLEAMRQGTNREASAKPRVLHVEDDPDLQRVIGSLCSESVEVECAGTVEEAARRLARKRYDVVILDLALPDRSGWELLPLIDRQTPRPLVLVFSVTELSRAESARVAGALVKSHASNPELLRAVRELAERARRGESGPQPGSPA